MRRFSRNFAFGEYISPSPLVSELPDALRADMRTGFCCARRARRARFDERVAPPTNEKSNPVGLLRSLRRVDKKDADRFYEYLSINSEKESASKVVVWMEISPSSTVAVP